MKRKKKQYGVQSTLRSKRFLVPQRFMEDEWDDEMEDVIGQPNEQPEQGK